MPKAFWPIRNGGPDRVAWSALTSWRGFGGHVAPAHTPTWAQICCKIYLNEHHFDLNKSVIKPAFQTTSLQAPRITRTCHCLRFQTWLEQSSPGQYLHHTCHTMRWSARWESEIPSLAVHFFKQKNDAYQRLLSKSTLPETNIAHENPHLSW